ncbi:MAG: hypothetical protein IT428_21645 [Planctomycetaceae bacterium]|nr:hypothetical protein [Planctomycetaceae bacterium]
MKTQMALALVVMGVASGSAQAGYHSYLESRSNVVAGRIVAAANEINTWFRNSPDYPLLYADIADMQQHVANLNWFTRNKGAMASMTNEVDAMLDTHRRLSARVDRLARHNGIAHTPHRGPRPAGRYGSAVDPYHVNVLRDHLALIEADLHKFHFDVQPAGTGYGYPPAPSSYDPLPRSTPRYYGSPRSVVPPAPPVPSGPAFPPRTGSRTFDLRTPGLSISVSR